MTLLATPITEPPKTCESTDCKGAGCVELSIEFWPPRPGCSAADWPGWGRLCCRAKLRSAVQIRIYLPEKLARQTCDATRQLPGECGGNRHLLQGMEVDAADELAAGGHVNQPPATVRTIHRLLIRLAKEMDPYSIGFGEVLETRRIFAVLLIIEADAANVLIAPPNGVLLAEPPALGEDIRCGCGSQQQHRGNQEDRQQDGISGFSFTASGAACAHDGLGSSMVSVARRPVLISCNSTLLFPICTSLYRPSKTSPMPIM